MKLDLAVIHVLSPDAISPKAALHCLTEKERDRSGRFHFPDDAIRWVSFRAQMRRILGENLGLPPRDVPLKESDHGKPLLAEPYESLHFNLSHCTDLGLLALSTDGPVGVDIESWDRADDLLECESTFCHPAEITALPVSKAERGKRLLEIWTAKEAVLKALGTGLSHPPESVRVFLDPSPGVAISDLPLPGLENLRSHVMIHPLLARHRAVLAADSRVSAVRFI